MSLQETPPSVKPNQPPPTSAPTDQPAPSADSQQAKPDPASTPSSTSFKTSADVVGKPGGQAKAKILIADDDITLRDMYQARLETDGYKVLVAADGEETLKVIREQKPDLILLDIMMPKMNGLDVLEYVKKDPQMRDIPVIVLTALIQDLTKVKSLMSGADDYLMKSEVMPGEVIQKVRETLAKAGKT